MYLLVLFFAGPPTRFLQVSLTLNFTRIEKDVLPGILQNGEGN